MIQFHHISKNYSHHIHALADINFKVEKGEFVFLTGPSGAGKTTLLRMIYAQEKPTSGQILVNNRNITKIGENKIPHLRRLMGIVFQDFKLLYNKTAYENVAFALQVLGKREEEIKKTASRALYRVGLFEKRDLYPHQFSGGQQQRIALARALVNDPLIILADEPTGNLDREAEEEVLKLLLEANESGATVVMATHKKELAKRFNKRMIHIDKGRIVETEAGEGDTLNDH